MKVFTLFATVLVSGLVFTSCHKHECQNCYLTVGGVAGHDTLEIREVCDRKEAYELESSSSGTMTWNCEKEKNHRFEECGTK